MDLSFFPLAQAAPPPDFLYQAGNQAIQISSVLMVGLSFLLAWFRSLLAGWRKVLLVRSVVFLGVSLCLVLSIGGIALFFFGAPDSAPLQANLFAFDEQELHEAQSVSEGRLAALLRQNPSLFLLDVREDAEREAGFIPGSRHIRMADISAGAWKNFPKDQPIYVHCATGTRSHAVAASLAQKGFEVFYLKGDIESWSKQAGLWQGAIPFQDTATRQLKKSIRPAEAYDLWKGGAFLVDARHERSQRRNPVRGSVSLPLLHLNSEEVEVRLRSFPRSGSVVILTDRLDLNDFSAFLTALRLDDLGYDVRGILFKTEEFLELL